MQSVQVGLAGGVENTWLGGHDIGAEGSYVWSDGSSWSFVNWRENHPNNGGADGNQVLGSHSRQCRLVLQTIIGFHNRFSQSQRWPTLGPVRALQTLGPISGRGCPLDEPASQ